MNSNSNQTTDWRQEYAAVPSPDPLADLREGQTVEIGGVGMKFQAIFIRWDDSQRSIAIVFDGSKEIPIRRSRIYAFKVG